MWRLLVAGLVVLPLGTAAAQRPAAKGECILDIENVDRQGVRVVTDSGVNYFAGGNIRISCRGMNVHMNSDSVAAYAGRTVQFIGHVHYVDSTVTMTADRGTYYKDGERWAARGNVVTTNLKTGSTLRGPSLDYLRPVAGVRDTLEMYAIGRPRISYAVTDSAGAPAEPYRIVADRVRMKGDDRVWAGGQVTIDRSDFAARGDSLRLFTGPAGDGTLLGGPPELRGMSKDTFNLHGKRIDFTLADRQLTGVTAKSEAEATTADRKLVADTIHLDVDHGKLTGTVAWGRQTRPHATATDYDVRADSLILETPGQQLRHMLGIGDGWLATRPDSVTGQRDWMAGDTVQAFFDPRDSLPAPSDSAAADSTAGGVVLQRMTAAGHARAFHASANEKTPDRPSLNYVRGDQIVITMVPGTDQTIDRVSASGHVEGIQLEPSSGQSTAAPAAPSPAQPRVKPR
jgi:hypothetical protein